MSTQMELPKLRRRSVVRRINGKADTGRVVKVGKEYADDPSPKVYVQWKSSGYYSWIRFENIERVSY